MTRELRSWHARAAIGLGIALPPLLGAAVGFRPSIPTNSRLPAALHAGRKSVDPTGSREILPGIRFAGTRSEGDSARIEIRVDRDPRVPDLLAYWSEAAVARGGELPADSWLLGSVPGIGSWSFRLPGGAGAAGGNLVLFGLARREVVASVPVVPVAPRTIP